MPTPYRAEDIQGDLVHMRFVEFADTDFQGTEQADGENRDGYLIYNDHRKDFGFGTFRTSDDYTLEADVLDYIRQQHPEFLPSIESNGGLFIGGTWVPITASGNLELH